MPIAMSGNRANIFGDARGVNVASNIVNYFEVGESPRTKYFLRGEMAGPDNDFLFNGILFLPDGAGSGTIIDNFPKGPIPKGWTKHPYVDGEGYKLTHTETGKIIFGYQTIENVCHVTTNVYNENGMIIAETKGN